MHRHDVSDAFSKLRMPRCLRAPNPLFNKKAAKIEIAIESRWVFDKVILEELCEEIRCSADIPLCETSNEVEEALMRFLFKKI